MKTELVICGVPFGTPREPEALRQVKDLGFTSVQLYTFWREYEPHGRGGFDWRALDRIVELLRQAGLKFVPFLLMGPRYAAPDWWIADAGHAGLRCLEHGKESPIESVWNPAFRGEISRVLEAFAARYLPADILESVQPGIGGDYGEALFPALGNWPGAYHTHRGHWCGGDDARADFRRRLEERYDTLDALNRAWRSRYARFQEIEPFLPQRAPSRTAYFD
ncbi:MAG: beta-galactosidase, partial [Planctomycetes bacterium]|nr:beta-galactosidase [Planctomycetota bacterium]